MRLTIKNRRQKNLTVQVDEPTQVQGLVFIAHGQGGFIEQKHIQAFADAFLQNGFRVVRFDAANSIGASDGRLEDATITSYYEDLEDVIAWAKTQDWYQVPFALCGHSMGGMTTSLYAENHPHEVLCLAPISTVVNLRLFLERSDPHELKAWKSKGFKESESQSKPGVIKRIGWGFVEDLGQHDILKQADKLTMPVLLMCGSEDVVTPLAHQKRLYDKILHTRKRLLVIEGGDHNFRGADHYEKKLQMIRDEISRWLSELEFSASS